MLGQPVSMLIPEVIGFRLEGRLPEGATATDLVLTVTELLREKGVVGKFVEFFGPGLSSLALADRATIGNMSPEYGATCAIFPVDEVTLQYLRFTGRSEERVALVEAYMKEQGLFHSAASPEPVFSDTLTLDLSHRGAEHRGPSPAPGPDPALRRAARVPGGAARPAAHRRARPREGRGQGPGSGAGRGRRLGRGVVAVARRACRDAGGCGRGARPRLGGDRGDHQLHQHLQSVGDAGGRSPGQEGGGARAGAKAVGQDLAGARLQGGHGLLRPRRPHALSGPARLQPRGLRLHHLHRQLGAAADGDLRCHPAPAAGRLLGALRQPQLRGPHQLRCARQLPDVAAAGGGVCAGGPDRHRPAPRAAGHDRQGRAGLPAGHLAQLRRGGEDAHVRHPVRHVPPELRRGVRGR